MVEKIGEGIEYRRRTDGFTLFVDNSNYRNQLWKILANVELKPMVHLESMHPDMEIHISDDTFEVLLMVHERYTRKLDRIDDPGYEKGGLV